MEISFSPILYESFLLGWDHFIFANIKLNKPRNIFYLDRCFYFCWPYPVKFFKWVPMIPWPISQIFSKPINLRKYKKQHVYPCNTPVETFHRGINFLRGICIRGRLVGSPLESPWRPEKFQKVMTKNNWTPALGKFQVKNIIIKILQLLFGETKLPFAREIFKKFGEKGSQN